MKRNERPDVDSLEDEIVRISGRWGEHDNDADEPVLEEACQRSVEGLVARPQSRERQDSLAPEFLDQSALGEDDAEDVAKRGQGDEDAEGPLGAVAKDIAEKRGREDATGTEDLVFGDGGKVCNLMRSRSVDDVPSNRTEDSVLCECIPRA
jgi:hypothetical protein